MPIHLPERLLRLAGPTSLVRRLSVQSVLSAFGDGVFLTGSAVFFTQVVGLSAARVGLGLSIAGAATFVLAVPLGRLSDRFGARRVWAIRLAARGAALPGVARRRRHGGLRGRAGRRPDRLDGQPLGAQRLPVRRLPARAAGHSNAYFRAARNVGYTLGALLAGLALATDSLEVIRAVPVATAVLLLLNAALVARLPATAPHHADPADPADAGEAIEAALEHPERGSALRNRGYVLTSVAGGVLGTHQVLLNVVIPLWLVEETDAPRVLLAWLFGTNTVMAVLLQVAAARGVVSVTDSLRAERRGRRSSCCRAPSC
ncbi:hypothetical protein GCM10025868_19100 [Angustibacter aerolatus]|uniref:Major facilitator superfamily (MFS) profile domain-containing protein n=1 Tax=Angustibacter aerolatus TaxID=1162965 RepID=A0ABQ6JHG3_9ACTN|nr:hypothetical protein [Angustibacter aerolatus]GMA86660.1 hypothetical protein GCM10025868_19100 [Angustibacter aerolatus]